ncbi:protein-glutamate methylesterase/protein-glutamine glutaminase [Brevibacillus choshinensis]|uniref:Protein-glutamate methylesterase/protein-glutamine glutaminase n=1 Tax=Brevibacillus choshinensis TaxID=54911 RepID=A0ABX7FH51_BRECH|nr:chemotaxis response regulator protein-glutamate methylesterase [Brevibacillus choshinensis]QRG65477.1 chemotaxis response regulator protein-glutamate methylesterase [Brevibacillus choshinensis]
MSKIRVLVTDDSAFMRKVISDILSTDPDIEVIDRARNGLECIEKCKQLNPDVLTLDIEMPVMDGLTALKTLMSDHPLPTVMLSSLTREGADATIQALELGAFDFVTKPSGPISLDIHKVGDRLIERVKAASLSKGRLQRQSTMQQTTRPQAPEPASIAKPIVSAPVPKETKAPAADWISTPRRLASTKPRLVTLGTSTGGPKALQVVLTAIPADFPAPIAVVQHMPAGFTKSLAQRLNTLSKIRVTEVEDGELLEPGTAYIAPGGYHFEVRQVNGRLQAHLQQEEPRGGHRPSVDVLFESASQLTNVDKWAIIMTGMGNDGTKGLKMMKELGTVTSIVEDESTCVVYGMPRSAFQAGLADNVAPVDKIPELLLRLVH